MDRFIAADLGQARRHRAAGRGCACMKFCIGIAKNDGDQDVADHDSLGSWSAAASTNRIGAIVSELQHPPVALRHREPGSGRRRSGRAVSPAAPSRWRSMKSRRRAAMQLEFLDAERHGLERAQQRVLVLARLAVNASHPPQEASPRRDAQHGSGDADREDRTGDRREEHEAPDDGRHVDADRRDRRHRLRQRAHILGQRDDEPVCAKPFQMLQRGGHHAVAQVGAQPEDRVLGQSHQQHLRDQAAGEHHHPRRGEPHDDVVGGRNRAHHTR